MDNITIHTTTEKIKKLYEDLSYFDEYGGTVFLFFFITAITFLVSGYFFMKINSAAIKADWANQRCSPTVIPFAGLINKPEDVSAFEFTQQNFAYCTDQMLIPITLEAISPFSYIIDAFLAIYAAMAAALNAIRDVIDKIRQTLTAFLNEILGRLSNFIVPLVKLVMSIRDTMAKVVGVMQTGLFLSFGAVKTMKSLLGSVYEICIILLITLVGAMIALYILIWIPFLTPIITPIVATMTIFYIAIAIVLLLMVAFFDTIGVHANGTIPSLPAPPAPPSCFDKNTSLKMMDGSYKTIGNVEVGDELYYDGKITAKMKLDASNMTMYNLNGSIISGCHYVYLEKRKRWIQVADHPSSIKVANYKEPFIYCINTTTKTIVVGNDIYIDWDEVLEYLTKTTETIDNLEKFHVYLDGGFEPNTKIDMWDGSIRNIIDVQINDVLLNGEKVYGLVEIDGSTVSHQYWYNSFGFIGGPNLNFCDADKFAVSKRELAKEQKCPKLYHLLTNENKFKVGSVNVMDYNSAIDMGISQHKRPCALP
jgi:hypothetical protein